MPLRSAIRVCLTLTAVALLAGCPEPRPQEPRPQEPRQQRPAGPAAPQPPGEVEPQRNVPLLVGELDQPDQRRTFYAAVELLNARGDPRAVQAIAERLDPERTKRVEQQKTLLDAIAAYPRIARAMPLELVKKLADLSAPFLGSGDGEVRKAAVGAMVALDAVEPNDADDPVARYILRILEQPKDQGASIAARTSAVAVIARKPPNKAIPLLNGVFATTPITDLREAVRKELYSLTGQAFRDAREARGWWEKNQDKTQDQWYQERIQRAEADVQEAREAARSIWRTYIQAIQTETDRHYAALKESLFNSVVPQIRIEAAKEILKAQRPDAYDVLVQALLADRDVEVQRAMLEDALAKQPPAAPEVRDRVIAKILDLTNAPEKEVRRAAVMALGELKAEVAVRRLLDRLASKSRDSEVAAAVLTALTRIGAKADAGVGKELNDFFQQELERPANDPLREPKLVELAAGTVAGLQYTEKTATEAERAVGLLVRLLEAGNPGDPQLTANARQVAIFSLGLMRRPSALRSLLPVLKDQDDQIASEAARAIGEILKGRLATPDKERVEGLEQLEGVFDAPGRAVVKDAALDAIRSVLKSDSPNLGLYRDATEKLRQVKDYNRIIRLLKDLPEHLAAGEPASARQILVGLRAWLADAYKNASVPDPIAAIDIWKDLASQDFERYAERLADEYAAVPSIEADEVYRSLIKRKPGDALRFWQSRIGLARKFLQLAAAAKETAEAATHRRNAVAIVERLRAEETGLPQSLKADFAELQRQLPADSGGRPDGTAVPTGLPRDGGGAPPQPPRRPEGAPR